MSKSDQPATASELQGKINRSLAWVSLASSLVGVLDIVATLILLAFYFDKGDYGAATFAISLFPILDLATDMGLAAAVIQRDDHSDERIATVFWINLASSLALFALLALGIGPFVAWLQNSPISGTLLTIYGSKLVWQNTYFLPYALMKKELRFKELSIIRILANLAEFAAKLGFAAAGAGLFCFVAAPLCRTLVTSIGVQVCHPWRPRLHCNLREGWLWVKFGVLASAHKLLFRTYSMLDKHIVGMFFGKEAAGVYTFAYQVVFEPALVISEVSANVAFPAFAKLKHERDRLYSQLVAFCRVNLAFMLLFVGFVFVCAEEIFAIVAVAKGEDYSDAASVARILCGVAVLRALSFVIPPFLDGVGRPDLNLRYSLVAAVLVPGGMVVSAMALGEHLGIDAIALGFLLAYPLAFAALVYMAFSVLQMSSIALYRRLASIFVCGLACAGLGALVKWASLSLYAPLRVALVAAVVVVSYSLLLQRFEGMSLRSAKASLKR